MIIKWLSNDFEECIFHENNNDYMRRTSDVILLLSDGRVCYKVSCDMKKVTRTLAYPILYYLKLRETRSFTHTREARWIIFLYETWRIGSRLTCYITNKFCSNILSPVDIAIYAICVQYRLKKKKKREGANVRELTFTFSR